MHATDTLNLTKWCRWNRAVTQINAFQAERSQDGDGNSYAFKESLIRPDSAGLAEKVGGKVEGNREGAAAHAAQGQERVLQTSHQTSTKARHRGNRPPRASMLADLRSTPSNSSLVTMSALQSKEKGWLRLPCDQQGRTSWGSETTSVPTDKHCCSFSETRQRKRQYTAA